MTHKIKLSQNRPIEPDLPQPVKAKQLNPITLLFNKIQEFNQNGSQFPKICNKIESKQKNTQWLYTKKNWANGQLEKIREIQKFQQTHHLQIKNLKQFNDSIKKTIASYSNLIRILQLKIQTAPPLLLFKDHVQPKHPIEAIFRYIGDCMNKILRILKHGFLFEKMDALLGEHQKISTGYTLFLNQILQNETFRGFLEDEQPTNFLNNLLDLLIDVRKWQLESITNGNHALSFHDKLPSGVSIETIMIKAEAFLIALKLLEPHLEGNKEQMNELQKLIAGLIENAAPRNTQAITDCLYPRCVLDSGHVKTIEGRVERSLNRRIASATREGPAKGFLDRAGSNLLEKVAWHGVRVREVESKDKIFVSGFYSISLLTPNGHQATSGAELDLSPLGELNQKQVKCIFDLTSTILASNFDLLDKPEVGMTEIEQKRRKVLVEKIEDGEANLQMQMNDRQIVKLRKIILDFSYKMTSAMTLALLTVSHTN